MLQRRTYIVSQQSNRISVCCIFMLKPFHHIPTKKGDPYGDRLHCFSYISYVKLTFLLANKFGCAIVGFALLRWAASRLLARLGSALSDKDAALGRTLAAALAAARFVVPAATGSAIVSAAIAASTSAFMASSVFGRTSITAASRAKVKASAVGLLMLGLLNQAVNPVRVIS